MNSVTPLAPEKSRDLITSQHVDPNAQDVLVSKVAGSTRLCGVLLCSVLAKEDDLNYVELESIN